MNQQNVWQIESLRLTAFLQKSDAKDGDIWFEHYLGVTPDTTEHRRAEGVRIDTSLIDGKRYTLQIRPDRVDWVIATEPESDEELAHGLGQLSDINKIVKYLEKWVSEVKFVTRLAFGVVAKIPANDKADSYEILSKYLHSLKIDPVKSSELTFKINRPRTFEQEDFSIEVNRISIWGAIRVQRLVQQLGFGQADGTSAGITRVTDVGQWARCELDISTDANRRDEIEEKWRIPLFVALNKMAAEILTDGDIE